MQELFDQLLSYLKATWRYRWTAVIIAWVVACVGWAVVYQLPDLYRATARVNLDTQTILRPLLSGLAVPPNMAQIVSMMSRTLISRPNLEKVVKMAGMDAEVKGVEERERLVVQLARGISIRSGGGHDLYTISYLGRTPQEAKRVVEAFLALFLQDSLGDKRKDSEAAQRFIDQQLASYKAKLKAAEDAVMEFKQRHVGLMPGEGQGYYARLRDAEATLRQAKLELREAENSRDAIQRQLSSYRNAYSGQGGDDTPRRFHSELDDRITALEKKLDSLLITYTDQHPDVLALKRSIAHLKEERAAEAKLVKPTPGRARSSDLGEQQLIVALTAAEGKVAAMRARVADRNAAYNELKAVADTLPKIEAQYTQLTRDYNVIRGRYNNLLERRENAEMSGAMEKTTVGLRVVDPPHLPVWPSSPNRFRLMSFVLLLALGGGLGIAFLLSQFKPTLDNERRLKEVSGLPVFGTVAMEWTHAQQRRRKRGVIAVIMSFVGLLSTYVAIMISLLLAVARG